MTDALTHPKYRPDIDGLRAFAVLAVVIYHAFPSSLPSGFTCVDVFFVISGFLISTIIFRSLENNQFSILHFYSRRVRRIFPVLIAVLCFTLIWGWLDLQPTDFQLLGLHIGAASGFGSNLLLWYEAGYFDPSSDLKPLLHLWSLGIEEQFYVFWPLILMFFWKRKKLLTKILLGLILISFIANLVLSFTHPKAAFYSLLTRFWELGLGGLLAWKALQEPKMLLKSSWASRISILGFILLILGFISIRPENLYPSGWALLPTLGAFFLIAAGPEAWVNKKILSQSFFVRLGLISYPLYLWHWLLLSFLHIDSFEYSKTELDRLKLSLVVLSFILAYLSYKWIETPVRKSQSKALVPALTGLMVIVAAFALLVFQKDGFPKRFPREISGLISPIDFEFATRYRVGICHYDSRAPGQAEVGKDNCIEKKKPLILVWGDSYAAGLSQGIRSLQSIRSFGFGQTTACGTPPMLDIKFNNDCINAAKMNLWNSKVLQVISDEKPQIVILHAFWGEYGDARSLAVEIKKTADEIYRRSPKTKTVVVGPVPKWGSDREGLPELMYLYWKTQPGHPFAPDYMNYGLRPEALELDQAMNVEIPKLGLKYLSVIHALCNSQGCRTRFGPSPTEVSAMDQGHLTHFGAEFVAREIAPELFSLLP